MKPAGLDPGEDALGEAFATPCPLAFLGFSFSELEPSTAL